MRRRCIALTVGPNFGDHKALWTIAKAHEHELAGAQFGDAKTAQGFHMHENVLACPRRRRGSRSREYVAEPLHLEANHSRAGLDNHRVRGLGIGPDGGRSTRPWRRCGRPAGHRAVERLDDDARTFIGGLVAAATETGDVEQDVRHAIVRHDESKPFAGVRTI